MLLRAPGATFFSSQAPRRKFRYRLRALLKRSGRRLHLQRHPPDRPRAACTSTASSQTEPLKGAIRPPDAARKPLWVQSAAAARNDSNLQHPQEALHLSHSGEAVKQEEEDVKALGAVAGG